MNKEFQDKIWCIRFVDLKPGDCFIVPLMSFPYPVAIHKKTEKGSLALQKDGKWFESRETHPFPPSVPVVPIEMPTQIIVKI